MKEEIKQFILDNNLLYPKINRNISRRIFWENRNTEWANFLYTNFNDFNKRSDISFSNFLKMFIFGEDIQNYYYTVEDFLNKTPTVFHNPGTKNYIRFFEDAKSLMNFEPINMTEIIYCFRNNLTSRPKCKECGNETKFTVFKNGFRTFCSQQCQIKFNNKIKEIKKSILSYDQIVEGINKIALDHRNLSNEFIASSFINILEFTSEFKNIPPSERIYIFVNNLSFNDVHCSTCQTKKRFKSQGVGYSATCGKKICIGMYKSPDTYYNEFDLNIRVCKGGSSFESGFLYILKSNSRKGFKIGITQDPNTRLKALKKFTPDLQIEDCFWLSEQVHETEQYFHKFFENKQINFQDSFDGHTEFFYLDKDDIKFIRNKIHESK
jgi:endogenous inhibitor of DNA gyrase (YacG/DUF329 family)